MKRKDIKGQLKEYFFLHPTARLRVRQMEREVKVPLPSAIRYAKELEMEGILKSTIIAGITVYAADRSSPHFLLEKKLHNLHSLYSSGLIAYLAAELSNPAIIIFGSYAKGEDVESSDIDLYIESASKNVSLEPFGKKLQRKIQLFQYKHLSLVKNKDLANNIINGIVLNGFVEVFR